MKKTTVRFIAVGAVLLLGALALALAQHDARQRSRETVATAKPPAEQPQPIPLDDNPLWGHPIASSSTLKTIVRANDGQLGSSPPALDYQTEAASLSAAVDNADAAPPNIFDTPANPLRGASAQLSDDDTAHSTRSLTDVDEPSSVQQAAGEGPPSNLGMPSAMPSIQASPLPVMAAPALPGESDIIKSPPPGWLQSPPSLPPSTAPGSIPAAPRAPNASSTSRSLSDTQRPAMPPSNMPSAPANFPGPPASSYGAPASGMPSPSSMPGMPTGNSSAAPSLMQPPPQLGGSAQMPTGAARNNGQLVTSPIPSTANSNTNSAVPSLVSSNAAGLNSASFDAPPAATLGSPQPASGRSPFAGTILGTLISNQPGNRHLDGSQNPVMLIQKRMAGECQVGKRATVVITVRNAGNSAAQDVEVIDSVPNGASFADAIPAVTPTADGILVWKLGEMGPGDERTINLQIVPERQGEMGSTAAVRFAAQASMRTLATLPKLEMTYNAAPEVLIGSAHSINVTVKNVGTGVARSVKLEADVPGNLKHESGDIVLEAVFGDIAPSESKTIRLDTLATEPGAANIALRAMTEDGVQQEQKVDLRILAPALEAVITGPNRRYLDRQAKFAVMIKNSGSAAATNCEFMVRLPAGLNFNAADKEGRYDAAQHAVLWSVPEFPAGHSEPVELTVLPVEVGTQQMTFQATADLGIKAETRGSVTVEEQGELTFSIEQDADPIEITSSTTYTIEVRNVGRGDRNIELSLQLPAGSEVLKVDAPVQARVDGDQLRFEPIPQMEGRTSQKFRVEVRHGKVGMQIVRAQLRSQNRPTLVIKEEATEVYNDRE